MKKQSVVDVVRERLALVDALGAVGARVQKPKQAKVFSAAVRDEQVKRITTALYAIEYDPDDDYTEEQVRDAVAALRAAHNQQEWERATTRLVDALDCLHGGSELSRYKWAMQNPEDAKREWRERREQRDTDDDE